MGVWCTGGGGEGGGGGGGAKLVGGGTARWGVGNRGVNSGGCLQPLRTALHTINISLSLQNCLS